MKEGTLTYRDDSAEQLRALIEAKLAGQTPAAPAPEEVPILPLVDASGL